MNLKIKNIVQLLILFAVLSSPALAQNDEGIIHFTRTSRWTKIQSSLTFLSKQEREKMAYMYEGRDEWKEYMLLYFNATSTKYVNNDERNQENNRGYSWRNEMFIVKRDFAQNTETELFEQEGKTYVLDDSLALPKWRILNELKDVAGHICMKAITNDPIKKQKVVAWFAQDIPHNGGPERYFGLPGMILELDLNDGAVVISAEKIEPKKLTNELEMPKKMKGTKVKEAEYQAMLQKLIDEKIKAEQNPFWIIRY